MNWFLVRELFTVTIVVLFYALPIGIPVYLFAPEYFLLVSGVSVSLVSLSILYSVIRSLIHRYRLEYISSEELQQTIDEFSTPLSDALNIPTPNISVVKDQVINARAGGLSYRTGYIELTEGLVMMLSRTDLKVVISHELSHIKSRDGLILHILQGPYSVVIWIMKLIQYIQLKTDSMLVSGPIFVVQIALKLYSSVLLMGIRSIMRGREHLADRDAARATSKSEVINTLETLQALTEETDAESTSLFSEYTSSLFSTHPDLEDRITHLQETEISSRE